MKNMLLTWRLSFKVIAATVALLTLLPLFAYGQEVLEPIVAPSIQSAFPYTKTFDITAYYSPVHGQQKYVTGSYESDIRLNGNGVHGASGKPVYPGMVAAPSVYPFGTKMYVPGVGTVAVNDRGGAIVTQDSDRGQKTNLKNDRLDIWMGYGDKGLERALGWGRRTAVVTIYGVDDSIHESVYLEGYSDAEKVIRKTFFQPTLLPEDVWYLSTGSDVVALQTILKESGYYKGVVNGFYGDETRDSVFAFQKDQGLAVDQHDLGAGHTGPQTRIRLEKIFDEKKSQNIPVSTFGSGAISDEVKKLQKILRMMGYRLEETGIFDPLTEAALKSFQKDQGLIDTEDSFGAGFFGPKTKALLEKKYLSFIQESHGTTLVDVPLYLVQDLKFGDLGPSVRALQQELQKLHFFALEPTGNYGELTEHAVLKFQQSRNLAWDKDSPGAGVFGPMTRTEMNELVASAHYTERLIADKKTQETAYVAEAKLVPEGLSFGDNGEPVQRLQNFLKEVGFLKDDDVTGFFGDRTRSALVAFQKTQKIIADENDLGAGHVGPQTKSFIDKYVGSKNS